jgi:predicted Zn-ribbon and HTH transcriptional regulator
VLDRKYLEQIARKSRPGANGIPILTDRLCDKCKYNLKGLSAAAVCPECGKPISANEEKEWKDPFPDDPRRARDQSAGLMAYEPRDLRRLARGTTLQAWGITLVAFGLFIFDAALMIGTYLGWDGSDLFSTFGLAGPCVIGGALWFFGGLFSLAPRRGRLDLQKFHRGAGGALGVSLTRLQRKQLKEKNAVGAGDYYSRGYRFVVQWSQLLLPLAAALNAAAFATEIRSTEMMINSYVPGGLLAASHVVWAVAVIALVPMVMFLFDLARTAGDDRALNLFNYSLWCIVVGAFSSLFILLVVPFLGLIGGPIGLTLMVASLIIYPGVVMLPLGVLSLARTCRWAPSLQQQKAERDAGRIAPKITSHGMDGKARNCQQCGYNLEGRKYGCRCPECNYEESE